MLSLVEITAFRWEGKSCNGFFINKFSTNESTQNYNRSCDLQPNLYLQVPTENHPVFLMVRKNSTPKQVSTVKIFNQEKYR